MKKNIQLRCSKALYYYKLALFFPLFFLLFQQNGCGFHCPVTQKAPRGRLCKATNLQEGHGRCGEGCAQHLGQEGRKDTHLLRDQGYQKVEGKTSWGQPWSGTSTEAPNIRKAAPNLRVQLVVHGVPQGWHGCLCNKWQQQHRWLHRQFTTCF